MRTSGSFGIRSRFRRSRRSHFSHASVLELHLINLPIKFVEALRREVNVTSEHVSSQCVSSHALLIFSHASCCFEHLILSAGWTIKWPGFSSLSNQLRPLERERILGTFCIAIRKPQIEFMIGFWVAVLVQNLSLFHEICDGEKVSPRLKKRKRKEKNVLELV
jgi:hypothetical protein